MSSPHRRADLCGTVLDGRYRVDRFVGQGAMGSVYAAVQLDLGRRVAIKVLDGPEDTPDLAALEREARAAARLAHPHIVQVTDFRVPDDGPAFLVMELLEGESLAERLAREGNLSADRAVLVAIQMLSGLAAAHAAGIVHRDVKPANVFLARTAATSDFVKILDFGVARVASRIAPGTDGPVGSPAYMAPELFQAVVATPVSDVYAVGVCLYEMRLGRLPFAATNLRVLVQQIRRGEVAPFDEENPLPGLGDVVRKALALRPEERWPSAEAMRAALASIAAPTAVPSQALRGQEPATVREASPVAPTDEAPSSAPAPRPAPRPSPAGTHTLPSAPPVRAEPQPSGSRFPFVVAAGVVAMAGTGIGVAWWRSGARASEPAEGEPAASACSVTPRFEPWSVDADVDVSLASAEGQLLVGAATSGRFEVRIPDRDRNVLVPWRAPIRTPPDPKLEEDWRPAGGAVVVYEGRVGAVEAFASVAKGADEQTMVVFEREGIHVPVGALRVPFRLRSMIAVGVRDRVTAVLLGETLQIGGNAVRHAGWRTVTLSKAGVREQFDMEPEAVVSAAAAPTKDGTFLLLGYRGRLDAWDDSGARMREVAVGDVVDPAMVMVGGRPLAVWTRRGSGLESSSLGAGAAKPLLRGGVGPAVASEGDWLTLAFVADGGRSVSVGRGRSLDEAAATAKVTVASGHAVERAALSPDGQWLGWIEKGPSGALLRVGSIACAGRAVGTTR